MNTDRYHVYLEILKNATDDWVDFSGQSIDRICFSKLPRGINTDLVLCVIESWGELDQRLGDIVTSPIQQLSALQVSMSSIWSNPAGTQSFADWLWALKEYNAVMGKSLDLYDRTAKLWTSNSINPGLLWNPATLSWSRYDGSSVAHSSPTAYPENHLDAIDFCWVSKVDSIVTASGKLTVSFSERQGNTDIGTAITSVADGKSTMTPMPFGNLQDNPSPCILVGDDILTARAVFSDAPCNDYDSLSVWSSELGQYIHISDTSALANASTTSATLCNSTSVATTEKARTEYGTWSPTATEAALYDPAAEASTLLVVNPAGVSAPEVIGLHTNLGPMINPTSQPRMASRGWGNSPKKSVGIGAGYYPAAAGTTKTIRATVTVYPIDVYEVGSTVAVDPADRVMLAASGDPWLFLENCRNGGAAPLGQDFIRTSLTGALSGSIHNIPHAKWIFKFPSIGIDGAKLVQASVKNAYQAVATRHSYQDPSDSTYKPCRQWTIANRSFAIGTTNDGSPDYWRLALASDYANSAYTFLPNDELDLAACQTLQLDLVIPYDFTLPSGATFEYTFFQLHGVCMQMTVDIPVVKAAMFFHGIGRSPGATVDMLQSIASTTDSGYSVDASSTLPPRTDIQLAGYFDGSSINFRDVLRDISAQAGNAILFNSTALRFTVQHNTATSLVPSYTIQPIAIAATNRNWPDFAYEIPARRTVISKLTIQYGWHAARKEFQHSLVASSSGVTIDNDTVEPTGTSWAQIIADLANADQTNATVFEAKLIQTDADAMRLALHILMWTSRPLMRAKTTTWMPGTSTIPLAAPVSINSIGAPESILAKPWIVTARTFDLDNLCIRFELQEVWRPATNLATLAYIDEAEISMICVDGSDGKGGKYTITAISDGSGPLLGLEWSSDNENLAVVVAKPGGKADVIAVSNGGVALGADVIIRCRQGAIERSCLVTIYQTMPTNLALIKGGCGGNTTDSQTALVEFYCDHPGLSIQSVLAESTFWTGLSAGANSHFYNYHSSIPQKHVIPWQGSTAASVNKPAIRVGTSLSYSDHFFGSATPPSTLLTQSIHIGSDGYYSAGNFYSPTISITTSVSTPNQIRLRFTNNVKKITKWAQSTAKLSISQNRDISKCEMFYVPQNYVKYHDTALRTNYTIILNIGTIGAIANLKPMTMTVPNLFFGV